MGKKCFRRNLIAKSAGNKGRGLRARDRWYREKTRSRHGRKNYRPPMKKTARHLKSGTKKEEGIR